METVIGMVGSTRLSDGRGQPDHRAAFRRRADGKFAADIFHSFAHVAQAISAGLVQPPRPAPRPLSSISNVKRSGSSRKRMPGGRGLRMFDDIVDRFLGGEENVVADFGRNGHVRQLRRHFEPIAQAGQREIFLRVFADVIDQPVQRVVGRIDRPDDFIQRAGRLARGLGNLPGVGLDFRRGRSLSLSTISPSRATCVRLAPN